MLELATKAAMTCADVGPGNFWIDSCFWRAFLTSPGLGALAAVIAALIVWWNSTADRRRAREQDRNARWWTSTTWAADHSFSKDSDEANAAFEALDALQDPVWGITDREMAFISVLTKDPIDELTDFEEELREEGFVGTIDSTEEESK